MRFRQDILASLMSLSDCYIGNINFNNNRFFFFTRAGRRQRPEWLHHTGRVRDVFGMYRHVQ